MSKLTHRITIPAGARLIDAVNGQPGPVLEGPLTVAATRRGFGTWLFEYGDPPHPHEVGADVPRAVVPLSCTAATHHGCALLTGTLADGFRAYGPFPNEAAATTWARAAGELAHAPCWTVPVNAHAAGSLPGQVREAGSRWTIVLAGDLFRGGLRAQGPFLDTETAEQVADRQDSAAFVLPLLPPDGR